MKTLKPGWQEERIANFHRAAMEVSRCPARPDLICDFWTEISRNLSAELRAEGWPELTLEEFMERREVMDYQVMERLRRRVDAIVKDQANGRGAQAVLPLPVQAAVLQRRLLPDLQPSQCDADRRVATRRASSA